MNGKEIMDGLIARGYAPVQAAAIAGHALQESGGNPGAVNHKEGANGLLQWRLDRWDNLQKFAKERGVSPADPNLQLDFIGREMNGPEARSAPAFLGAQDVDGASAALKRYIRFGDKSDGVRLANAKSLLGGAGMLSPTVTTPTQSASAAPAASPMAAPVAPAASPAEDDSGLMASLQGIQQMLAQQGEQAAPVQLDFSPTPNMLRARQLALAMQKQEPLG